jgi:hypothetical protein
MIFQNLTEHQAYDTHFNYIKCLCALTKETTILHVRSLKKEDLPDIDQKKISNPYQKSLNDDKKIVNDKNYSKPQHLAACKILLS